VISSASKPIAPAASIWPLSSSWRSCSRYYERIGDHPVNIGERVNYTGWLPEYDALLRQQHRAHPLSTALKFWVEGRWSCYFLKPVERGHRLCETLFTYRLVVGWGSGR
jgi:hypothetical protein